MTLSRSQERRLVLRLLGLWDRARAGRDRPTRDDMGPDALGEAWDRCVLVRLEEEADPVFERVCPRLREPLADGTDPGADWAGLAVSRVVPDGLLGRLVESVPLVARTASPLSSGGCITRAGQTWLYRALTVPLDDAEGRLRYVLGAAGARVAD